MGWNDLRFHDTGRGGRHDSGANGAGHPVLAGLADGDHAYFVHSYGYRCADEADLLATCDYGGRSRPSSGGTIWSAPSSIPRRASRPACA